MARRGAWANRNAGHRARRDARIAAAAADWDLLGVSFDAFRSAVRLLQRRRQPSGTPPGIHDTRAQQLIRDAAAYLRTLAERIDAGEFDATKETA